MKAPYPTLESQDRVTSLGSRSIMFSARWEHEGVEHGTQWEMSETRLEKIKGSRVAVHGFQMVINEYVEWLNSSKETE